VNHDESEALEQQKKSDIFSIGVPEISVNPLTTTTVRSPSILSKLMAGKTSGEKIATTTPKQYLHLAEIFSLFNSKFPQLRRGDATDDNEISDTSADMIEIEVPLVGNEFARNFNVDAERINNEINVDKESDEDVNEVPEGYVEISIMPSTTTETQSKEITDFQSFGDTTTFENFFETSPSYSHPTENPSHKSLSDDMEGVESKLMDHWNHLENVGDDFGTTQQTEFYTRKHSPMTVTIVVNSQTSRCKNNPQCRQVNFAKHYYDIDRQYPTDSDEDLFFKSEPSVYSEKRNQLKSRRAVDDGFFNFPRLTPSDNNYLNFPQPAPVLRGNMPPINLKKPKWIEKIESESSLERSERVNKDLGNMMKLVAVWAHLDKFVSNRARSIVGKVAGFDDPPAFHGLLGASNPNESDCGDLREEIRKLKAVMPKKDEPFT
jgi:hypothetical protein